MTILPLNQLVLDTGTPPVSEAREWRDRYDGRAGPLIDLSQASPGYPPHPDLLECLSVTSERADTARYGPVPGDEALREAYAAEMSQAYGGAVEPYEIAITAGCNQAFFVSVLALAKAGDAVILPSPWYFNHEMSLNMLGIEVRPLVCEAALGFVPQAEEAERLIDERVRAIVLVTPNNPTGAVYPPETIARFAELCRARGLWLILDETYRDFLPGGQERAHDLMANGAWRQNVIHLYSFSKSFAIPGYRLGAVTAERDVIPEISKVLDCVQICAPRIGQSAVTWALGSLGPWRQEMREKIADRAEAFAGALEQAEGWQVDSIGAYFAFVRHPFSGVKGERLCEGLTTERGLLSLPGCYFGQTTDSHVRMAFANADLDDIAMIPERLNGFCP